MDETLDRALGLLEQTAIRLADDRLILLEALQAIADQEQHDGDAETHMHDMADLARAAIAKAGRQS